jgi:hypothetical protein
MGAGSEPPRGARIIHHGVDELLIKQGSFPDGEITLTVQEGTQHTDPFLSDLIGVRRPVELCI